MKKTMKVLMGVFLALNLTNVTAVFADCPEGSTEITVKKCELTDAGTDDGVITPGSKTKCGKITISGKTFTAKCTCGTWDYTRTCESQADNVAGCEPDGGGSVCQGGSTTKCTTAATVVTVSATNVNDLPGLAQDACEEETDACEPAACPAAGGPEDYCCPKKGSTCTAKLDMATFKATGTSSIAFRGAPACTEVTATVKQDAAKTLQRTNALKLNAHSAGKKSRNPQHRNPVEMQR